jgi:lipid-binding SYLF domain-containing protein
MFFRVTWIAPLEVRTNGVLLGFGSMLCVTSFDFVFVFVYLKGVHGATIHGRFTEIPGFGSVGFGLGWSVSLGYYASSFLFVSFFSSVQGMASFGWVPEAYSSL